MSSLFTCTLRLQPLWIVLAGFAVVSFRGAAIATDDLAFRPSDVLTEAKMEVPSIGQRAGSSKEVFEVGPKLRPGGRIPADEFGKAHSDRVEREPLLRGFPQQRYHWKASKLHHRPLYFQDVSLERYGQTHVLQPLVSALKFFGTVPVLPYKMGLDRPRDCEYTLGYARPGSCACPVKEHLPFSRRGAILQATATSGFIFLFP